MEYKACVLIGRFEPPHKNHFDLIYKGLEIAEKLIMVIGSNRAAPTIHNPFSFQDRVEMISKTVSPEQLKKIIFIPVRDYYYNDNHWLTELQQKVNQHISYGDSIALLGNYKDDSSYYLKMFPQWDFMTGGIATNLSATAVREALFKGGDWESLVPKGVSDWLKEKFLGTELFLNLQDEFKHVEDYKVKSKFTGLPYDPVFVTTDAVVVQSGHILVIKRGFNPGKGLLALPGGFIKKGERLKDCVIRELREETGIKVPAIILKNSVKDTEVFDHPKRSLRGRTITHAFYIRLENGELPDVKGNDDASGAFWMPLMDVAVRENEFFEDHCHIISHFVNRN